MLPHGPSSFTVTVLERKRSKQTCGGREFLTWWIAVISIRLPSARSYWWRLLSTDSPRDWVTRHTEPDLWPKVQPETWDTSDPCKATIQSSLQAWAALNVNIFLVGTYLQHGSGVFGGRRVHYQLAQSHAIRNDGGGFSPWYRLHSAHCLPPVWLPASSSWKRSTGRPDSPPSTQICCTPKQKATL